MKYRAEVEPGHELAGAESYEVDIEGAEGKEAVALDGSPREVQLHTTGKERLYALIVGGRRHEAYVERGSQGYQVLLGGRWYSVRVEDARLRELRKASGLGCGSGGALELRAPMPGLVVRVNGEEGQGYRQGESVLVLEAMKMENEIRLPRGGKLLRLAVRSGDKVEQGQLLAVFE